MAEIWPLRAKIELSPGEDTMKAILALLDLWQDANPDKMVAMVPQNDRYGYEIIGKGIAEDEL